MLLWNENSMAELTNTNGPSVVAKAEKKVMLECNQVPQDRKDEGVRSMGDTACTDRTNGTQQFSTSNLAVAAFLTAGRHLALNRVDFDDHGIAIFVFDDPQGRPV
jgi:hypothetical protein